MKIAVDTGHCLRGADTGAQGCGYREEDLDRKVGYSVIAKLKKLGHTVIHVSPDSSNSIRESLNCRVNKINASNVDFSISIHLNSGGGHGTEIFTYGGARKTKAVNILNNIVALGFTNRGVKNGSGLALVRGPKAEACLLEICFIDCRSDVDRFKDVGPDKIADAIVKGIVGTTVTVPSSRVSNSNNSSSSVPLWKQCVSGDIVKRLQHELNSQFNAGIKEDGYFGNDTLNKCITVHRGAKGNISKIIQERLIAHGAKNIIANGVFQDGTYGALKTFQKQKGLCIDGICGKDTWVALFKS